MDALQQHFLEAIAPILERQVKAIFRNTDFEEATQAALALGWHEYMQAVNNGQKPEDFATVFSQRVCKHLLSGRRVDGSVPVRDASRLNCNDLGEITDDDRPADAAVFRIDFKDWRERLPEKKGKIVDDLALGESTTNAAEKYRVSRARISQIRREAEQDWMDYEKDGLIR